MMEEDSEHIWNSCLSLARCCTPKPSTSGGGGCLEHTRLWDRFDFTHGTVMLFQGRAPKAPRQTDKVPYSSRGTAASCAEKVQVVQGETLPWGRFAPVLLASLG